jgi:heptosyltransferase I
MGQSANGFSRADWWISRGLGFIADHAMPPRQVREMRSKIGLSEFRQLLRETKARQYKAAVVLHAPWWVNILLWLARIPKRVGVKSQWHSFLFLNHGIRQKRSLSEMSELDYNLRVVEEGFELNPESLDRHGMKLAIDSDWQNDTLKRYNLTREKYSVVHPGMSGSARNWPTELYGEWIKKASKSSKVVITGTASDNAILDALRALVGDNSDVIWLDAKLSGPQLLHILHAAKQVLAPSTGIAHLAAALGRSVIGLYSPMKVQHPTRWRPLGPSVKTLTPAVECPAKTNCLGANCAHFDCMKLITIAQVQAAWRNP